MGKLEEQFLLPPFSVLDTRQGYWQERKRQWLGLGIKSEVGRNIKKEIPERTDHKTIPGKSNFPVVNPDFDEKTQKALCVIKVYGNSVVERNKGGITFASIFDPVLTEVMYQWFVPCGGSVLDPFAGGSVRGIVASKLGFEYTGIELRKEQVESNREQAEKIGVNPKWIVGDSNNLDTLVNEKFDFIFSCPPYYNLEVYSDLLGELSALKTYKEFLNMYYEIIKKSVSCLKSNRFASFVVGDIRDKEGFYRNFVSNTIDGFLNSGMKLYNHCILVNSIGTLPLRIGIHFKAYKKIGKCHQNIPIFYKGDPQKIKDDFPEIQIQKSVGLLDRWI